MARLRLAGALGWLLAALALPGCVYSEQVKGHPVRVSSLPPLVKGRTRERELLVALGPPGQVSRRLGETRYTWRFSRQEVQSLHLNYQGFRILEGSYEDTTTREAFFDFDKQGRLIRWSISASAAPTD